MTLVVNDRYRGQHGIARYATETLARLEMPWRSLGGSGTPTAIGDVINRRRLRLSAADVLYSPGISTGPSRARQVLTVHDLIHLHDPRGGKAALHRVYYERVLRPIVRRAGHVFTVSASSARELRDWVGPGVSVHNTGNGCSEEFSATGPRLARDRPYVVYVGNLKPHKNPDVVVRALPLLPEGLDLLMVTSEVEKARSLAQEHGVLHRVSVVSGPTDAELAAIYRGAKALVFPSRMEGFGLPVVESLRCGTPVVYLTSCDAVSDICAGTQYGFDDPNDLDDVAAVIATAIDRGLGPTPRLDHYSWSSVARRVEDQLANL